MSLLRPPPGRAERDVQRYLIAGEDLRFTTRLHWLLVAEPVAVAVTALVVTLVIALGPNPKGSFLTEALVIATIAVAIRAAARLDSWRRQWFVLTNQRVLLVSSFIGHTVSSVTTSRVTHLSYDQTALGHVLGYAHFVFQSAGKDQALYTVKFVPGGLDVYRAVVAVITNGELDPDPDPTAFAPGVYIEDDPTRRLALPTGATMARGIRRWRGHSPSPRGELARHVPEPAPSTSVGAVHEPLVDDDDGEHDDSDHR